MSIKMDSIRKWAGPRRFTHPVHGVSLVELVISGLIIVVVLSVVQFFLLGSLQSFASLSVGQTLHTEFLALRDQLGRDIQHASVLIDEVSLDGQRYQAETGPEADSLVLRLPAVDAGGVIVPERYDFIVYTVQQAQGRPPWLSWQLFVNRDVQGTLLTPG